MNIRINDQYLLKSDPCNFILCEMGEGKRDGVLQPVVKREWYYPTLSQVFDSIVLRRIQTADMEDWKAALTTIEHLRHDTMSAIETLGVENVAVKS